MRYTIRGGTLYRGEENTALCHIRGVFGEEKWIEDAAGCPCLYMNVIRNGKDHSGDVRFHRYTMNEADGREIAFALPDYAAGHEPKKNGWPLNRMPRVDRAMLQWQAQPYCLMMYSSSRYALLDCFGKEAVSLEHRGIMGGWKVTARDSFPPVLIGGLFVFCRYLEKENDMILI